jgi:ArsR family transcriptional regulator
MMRMPSGFPWEDLGRQMAEVLKALGDVNRMKIIKVLASNPEESVRVNDLAEALGISQPATSQHIRVLRNVGILVPNRVGNSTYYSIDAEQLREYNRVIDDMFRKAFVRCDYDGDCSTCPDRTMCS